MPHAVGVSGPQSYRVLTREALQFFFFLIQRRADLRMLVFFLSFFFSALSTLKDLCSPTKGLNPGPRQWEHGVLTTGQPGNLCLYLYMYVHVYNFKSQWTLDFLFQKRKLIQRKKKKDRISLAPSLLMIKFHKEGHYQEFALPSFASYSSLEQILKIVQWALQLSCFTQSRCSRVFFLLCVETHRFSTGLSC